MSLHESASDGGDGGGGGTILNDDISTNLRANAVYVTAFTQSQNSPRAQHKDRKAKQKTNRSG